MYSTDDVELLLPSVCWTHHLHPERSMYGRARHACCRNEAFWANPPRRKPKGSIDPAKFRDFTEWEEMRDHADALRPVKRELTVLRREFPEDRDVEDELRLVKKALGPIERRIEAACMPGDRPSFINPKASNGVWAELIDMQVGWDYASLTDKERAALFLTYGCRWTHEEIAFNQNVDRTTITHRLAVAIDKIVNRLNGGVWDELLGVEA